MKTPTRREIYDFYNDNKKYAWTLSSIENGLEPYDMARVIAVKKILMGESGSLLDVGAGSGEFSFLAYSLGYKVVGTDISKSAISLLNKKSARKDIKFVESYAEKLPFSNDKFDVVLCLEVLEHLVKPEDCLREIKRVLNKDGVAIITVPNWFNLDRLAASSITSRYFLKLKNSVQRRSEISAHLHFHSPKEWESIFIKNDFKVKNSRPVYIFPSIPKFDGALSIFVKIEKKLMNKKIVEFLQSVEERVNMRWPFYDLGQSHLWVLKKSGH